MANHIAHIGLPLTTAGDLMQVARSHGHPLGDTAQERRRLCNALYRLRRQEGVTGRTTKLDDVREAVAELERRPLDVTDPTAPVVLPGWTVTQTEVLIPLSCRAMITAATRHVDVELCLVLDGKWKTALDKWAILTMGYLTAGTSLRHTTTRREFATGGRRHQSNVMTARFIPLAQAIVSEEPMRLVDRFVAVVARHWPVTAAHDMTLPQRVVQLHKDYARSFEAARRVYFPGSRSCRDFAHMARNIYNKSCAQQYHGGMLRHLHALVSCPPSSSFRRSGRISWRGFDDKVGAQSRPTCCIRTLQAQRPPSWHVLVP